MIRIWEGTPNYFTAAVGGIITAIGGLIADKIEIQFLAVIILAMAFFMSVFYLVVDVDSLKGRFKNNGIKATVFPCNKEEIKIVLKNK